MDMTATSTDEQRRQLALRLVDEFGAFMPALARWIKSSVRESDLTYPRLRLLYALHCKGPQIMSELSEQLGVSPRNVTALVDALERDSLVQRHPHPTDRRATLVELTPGGAEGWATIYSEYRLAMSELFSELSEADLRELLRLVGSLRSALQRKGITFEQPVAVTKTGGRG